MAEQDNLKQLVLRETVNEAQSREETSKDATEVCVICLEAISESALALPCRHENFDFICLLSWLQEQTCCPLCKHEVRRVEYDRSSAENAKIYDVPDEPHLQSRSSSQTSPPVASRFGNARSGFRRRRAHSNRHDTPARPGAVLQRRREIYRKHLYSLHVGSNRLSRFRDLTPEFFARDHELLSRARKWIRRELQVFQYLNAEGNSSENGTSKRANNAEFLLEYIIAILKTVHIKGSSGQAEEMLQDFLGRDDARLFLHELQAWLRSPYTELSDWDRRVQYNENSETSLSTSSEQCSSRGGSRYHPQGGDRATWSATRAHGRSPARHLDRYRPYQNRASRSTNIDPG